VPEVALGCFTCAVAVGAGAAASGRSHGRGMPARQPVMPVTYDVRPCATPEPTLLPRCLRRCHQAFRPAHCPRAGRTPWPAPPLRQPVLQLTLIAKRLFSRRGRKGSWETRAASFLPYAVATLKSCPAAPREASEDVASYS
jgi:hypothetical protein